MRISLCLFVHVGRGWIDGDWIGDGERWHLSCDGLLGSLVLPRVLLRLHIHHQAGLMRNLCQYDVIIITI